MLVAHVELQLGNSDFSKEEVCDGVATMLEFSFSLLALRGSSHIRSIELQDEKASHQKWHNEQIESVATQSVLLLKEILIIVLNGLTF